MTEKKTTEQAVAEIDQAAILKALLDEVRQIKADRDADKAKFEEELAAARAVADSAVAKAAEVKNDDPYRPNALPEGSIDPRTDHPAGLNEKLDCMETLTRENGQPFDRERTRRALLGLPVEDINKFVYQGHAFETQEELDAYVKKVEDEKIATIGKYLR